MIQQLQKLVWMSVKSVSYYFFLFFFGFFVCYIWAHSQREELAYRVIEIEATNKVIEELCFSPKGSPRYGGKNG